MNEDLYLQIIERYPRLYRHCKCIDCGDGWLGLIDELSAKLEALISEVEQEYEESFYATQVKEKYGTLRFYMSGTTDAMDTAIYRAEELSGKICEVCGLEGKTRGNHWVLTLCDECNKWWNSSEKKTERPIIRGKSWEHI